MTSLNVLGIQLSSNTVTLPTSIGTLWSYLSTKKHIFKNLNLQGFLVKHEGSVLNLLKDITEEPHIILVSMYMWNKARSNKLTKHIKKKYPNSIIIIGGNEVPQVKTRFEKFAKENPQYDYYVWSEGEVAVEKIFEKILSEKGLLPKPDFNNQYPFSFVKNGNIEILANTKLYLPNKTELDFPSACKMGIYDDLVKKLKKYTIQGILETNRGCPYSCTFCDWGLEEKLRRFSMQRIKDEIDWLVDNVHDIHLADANYGILNRDLDIVKYLIDKKNTSPNAKTFTLGLSYTKNGKDNMIEIARLIDEADLTKMGASFSLQSLDTNTLKAVKRTNMQISYDPNYIMDKFTKENIPFYNDVIIGLPEETLESFAKGLDFLMKNDPLDIMIHRLYLLENAEVYRPESIKKYDLQYSWQAQLPSECEDEIEWNRIIESTSTMSKEDMWYAVRLRDFVNIFWLGKIVYYIGRYLQTTYKIDIATLFLHFIQQTNASDIEFWKTFYEMLRDTYTNVCYDHKKSTTAPRVNRSVNIWMYINDNEKNRQFFYQEFYNFIIKNYDVNTEILDDVFEFNKNFVFDSNFALSKEFNTLYDWIKYFKTGNLKQEKTNYLVGIHKIGYSKSMPQAVSFIQGKYLLSGGHDYLLNKIHCHTYDYGIKTNSTTEAFTKNLNAVNKNVKVDKVIRDIIKAQSYQWKSQ